MNFIAGSGGEIGEALVNAKPLKAISFTGSCEIGNWIHTEASKRRLRIQLEMGGKNPTIVLDDADFNTAVENTVNAAFFSTGQKCTATSRVDRGRRYLQQVRRCDGRAHEEAEDRQRHGAGHRHRTCGRRRPAQHELEVHRHRPKESGNPKVGGNRLSGGAYDKGYFCEPTIFADVEEKMTLAQEEIFGPVLAVMPAKNIDHALEIANNIPFGLSASIQT